MNYFLHPNAEAELIDSVIFYESNSKGLGEEYFGAFEKKIKDVCDNPKVFPYDLNLGVRKATLVKFPFIVYFREHTGMIQIIAISHQSRKPEYRLEDFNLKLQEV